MTASASQAWSDRSDTLLRVLRSPSDALRLGVPEWEDLLWRARKSHLSGRLWHLFNRAKLADRLPDPVRRRLLAAFLEAEHHRRRMLWEVDRLHNVLQGTGLYFALLKGAAYAALGLDVAQGRTSADVDIIVPQKDIESLEDILLKQGWEHVIVDSYDQRYYRHWMHELPPLRHRIRDTVLDLHHAIVPLSSRLHPDTMLLFERAVVADARGTKVLAPPDMVLHGAVHLFYDGEVSGALRDLSDLDGLLREFGARDEFWPELTARAKQLGLERPLFYALRYTRRLLGTPIPPEACKDAEAGRPAAPLLLAMDHLVERALMLPPSRLSRLCLYIRSHWLRMSPALLAAHLARKSIRRWRTRSQEA